MPELILPRDKYGLIDGPFYDPDASASLYLVAWLGGEADGSDRELPEPLPGTGKVDVEGVSVGAILRISKTLEDVDPPLHWLFRNTFWVVLAVSAESITLFSATPNSEKGVRKWLRLPPGQRALAAGQGVVKPRFVPGVRG